MCILINCWMHENFAWKRSWDVGISNGESLFTHRRCERLLSTGSFLPTVHCSQLIPRLVLCLMSWWPTAVIDFLMEHNKIKIAGFKFLVYSIYIQLSSYKDIGYIFPTNSVHIQYISSVQFLTVPTGIRAVTSTWRTMTNELRRRRGVPTSRMESWRITAATRMTRAWLLQVVGLWGWARWSF